MSVADCECPNCRRPFVIRWKFDTVGITRVEEEDGDVLTDSDDMYATRVVYQRHVTCPFCGARLCLEHELWPRFYASKED